MEEKILTHIYLAVNLLTETVKWKLSIRHQS